MNTEKRASRGGNEKDTKLKRVSLL